MVAESGTNHIAHRIEEALGGVIRGKEEPIRLLTVSLLARGHALLEDIPGVGKTTLARAVARAIHSTFRRVQGTPDMLPADILGVSIYHPDGGDFRFHPGPVFANILLVDEINRMTPRAQSALLECMEERQVTLDGATHPLPDPFLVVATQNPVDHAGTYLLPDSQMDRFLLSFPMGYPERDAERRILLDQATGHPVDALDPVADAEGIVALQRAVREVRVDDAILEYVMDLVEGTRSHPSVSVGISPRGTLGLRRASQALALIEGRDYCLPDDPKRLAVPVLAHRLQLRQGGGTRTSAKRAVIRQVLASVPVPA